MVVASTYRDQPQNKKQAMTVLMAKLEQLEEEAQEKELSAATGGRGGTRLGTQIRSYVFYDNRVKDHRTGCESTDYERALRASSSRSSTRQPVPPPEREVRRAAGGEGR